MQVRIESLQSVGVYSGPHARKAFKYHQLQDSSSVSSPQSSSFMALFGSSLLENAASLVKDPLHLVSNSQNSSSTLIYKGTVIVKKTNFLDVTNLPASAVDTTFEVLGQKVSLQLISSTEVEQSINSGKLSPSASLEKWFLSGGLLATDEVKYSVTFQVDSDFGVPGAFTIKNLHPSEFYLVSLSLQLPGGKVLDFPCNSWVYNISKYKTDRIFFSNELYLPQDTPAGLVEARKTDLKALRGDGSGTRQNWDRIYDYDVYNDLGADRPTLGGRELPYPRRCRTGRTVVNGAETRPLLGQVDKFYVPSDEIFSSTKNSVFLADSLKAASHSLIPALTSLIPRNETFRSFNEIQTLYDQGLDLSKVLVAPIQIVGTPFDLVNELTVAPDNSSLLKFPVPQVIEDAKKGWMSDEEFSRQMLAGVNPMMIECLKVFPPNSQLDPEKYGTQTSAITEEHILNQLEGKSAEEALRQKKLFILDYHDAFLPYLEKINAQPSAFSYATRTLLYLTPDGTLKPIAIELRSPNSRQVVVPPTTREPDWLWELAKAHAVSNNAGFHQLISHWLRTHACVEPFILATNRQLSTVHPLNPFLKPHFKNTMMINSSARQNLISSGGIIERTFTTGKYSLELSAVVYKSWRFDEQGLPADLIKRGMAVPDPQSKHGLKLTIEDYPYAVDGLEIWSALEGWASDYVDAVYKDDQAVISDPELQAWWSEVVNQGHEDKKNEKWWLKMDSKKNLVNVLTTLIWVASAHHAAVNFGQYAYYGYMPNHPTATHRALPASDSAEYKELLRDPEAWFLTAVSAKLEAVIVMLTVELLSTHSADEEYLGERAIKNWTSNDQAQAAFEKFSHKLKEVEENIKARNKDSSLKNRRGPVNLPYTLLVPSSERGITGKGVPSSISI